MSEIKKYIENCKNVSELEYLQSVIEEQLEKLKSVKLFNKIKQKLSTKYPPSVIDTFNNFKKHVEKADYLINMNFSYNLLNAKLSFSLIGDPSSSDFYVYINKINDNDDNSIECDNVTYIYKLYDQFKKEPDIMNQLEYIFSDGLSMGFSIQQIFKIIYDIYEALY